MVESHSAEQSDGDTRHLLIGLQPLLPGFNVYSADYLFLGRNKTMVLCTTRNKGFGGHTKEYISQLLQPSGLGRG